MDPMEARVLQEIATVAIAHLPAAKQVVQEPTEELEVVALSLDLEDQGKMEQQTLEIPGGWAWEEMEVQEEEVEPVETNAHPTMLEMGAQVAVLPALAEVEAALKETMAIPVEMEAREAMVRQV